MNKIIFKKVNLPADVDFSIWNKMLLEADFISLLFGCNRCTLYTVHCLSLLLIYCSRFGQDWELMLNGG